MAQKRRDEARMIAQGNSKRSRQKSPAELFWGSVLSWEVPQLDRESALAPLPNSFVSSGDYYSRFKPLVLAEAKATLARTTNFNGAVSLKKSTKDDDEILHWGARLLFFDFARPLRPDQRESLKPGQVFVLSTPTSSPVLAAWANGCTRRDHRSALVLMVTNPHFSLTSSCEARPLESLLSLQRMFDACARQPIPPFLPLLLAGRKGTHTRFDNANEDLEENDFDHENDAAATASGDDGNETDGILTDFDAHGIHTEATYAETGISVGSFANNLISDLADNTTQRLNSSQRRALNEFTTEYKGGAKLSLVQGPPGSGKTSFLVATLLRLMCNHAEGSRKDGRVLVCAPSNKAIVLLLERFFQIIDSAGDTTLSYLARSSVSLLGVPEKIDSVCGSLDSVGRDLLCWHQVDVAATEVRALLKTEDSEIGFAERLASVQSSVRQRLPNFYKLYAKPHFELALFPSQRTGQGCRDAINGLVRALQVLGTNKEAVDAAAADVLALSHFVFATIGSVGASALRVGAWGRGAAAKDGNIWGASDTDDECVSARGFGTVLVDEAGQAVEADIFIPIGLGAKRLLLVGDPQQLPATTFSRAAKTAHFDRSLLARLMEGGGEGNGLPAIILDTQYRMAEPICRFPAMYFYGGKLLTANGTGACKNWQWPRINDETLNLPLNSAPRGVLGQMIRERVFGGALSWVNVGDKRGEERDKHSLSIRNQSEANLVVDVIRWLVDEAKVVTASDVVVITTYSAQVSLLREMLRRQTTGAKRPSSNVAVHTVDSFQGSEASVVLLSLVRSNQTEGVGFLSDGRRINVAITRAKDLLLIVGDSATLATEKSSDTVVASLYQEAVSRGHVTTELKLRGALEQPWPFPSEQERIEYEENNSSEKTKHERNNPAVLEEPVNNSRAVSCPHEFENGTDGKELESVVNGSKEENYFEPSKDVDTGTQISIAAIVSDTEASSKSSDECFKGPVEGYETWQADYKIWQDKTDTDRSLSTRAPLNYQVLDECDLREIISVQCRVPTEQSSEPPLPSNPLAAEEIPPTLTNIGSAPTVAKASRKQNRKAHLPELGSSSATKNPRKRRYMGLAWRGPAFVIGSRRLLGPSMYS